MGYLILFAVVGVVAALIAIWFRGKFGQGVTLGVGVLLTIATVVLFVLAKSDSVADTFLEKLADMSPPLVTGAVVIGWWLGYGLARMVARMRA
jgi:hypothetical protein